MAPTSRDSHNMSQAILYSLKNVCAGISKNLEEEFTKIKVAREKKVFKNNDEIKTTLVSDLSELNAMNVGCLGYFVF